MFKIWAVISAIIGVLDCSSTLLAQPDPDLVLDSRVDSLLKRTFGPNFTAGAVLDVDQYFSDISQAPANEQKYLFEDPQHELNHSLIAPYGRWDSTHFGSRRTLNDSGGVVTLKSGKVSWYSKRLILKYSEVSSYVWTIADVDGDGHTDILVIVSGGGAPWIDYLWIISPTPQGGRLLNATDKKGRTLLKGSMNTFTIWKTPNTGSVTISAIAPHSDDLHRIDFKWDGHVVR